MGLRSYISAFWSGPGANIARADGSTSTHNATAITRNATPPTADTSFDAPYATISRTSPADIKLPKDVNPVLKPPKQSTKQSAPSTCYSAFGSPSLPINPLVHTPCSNPSGFSRFLKTPALLTPLQQPTSSTNSDDTDMSEATSNDAPTPPTCLHARPHLQRTVQAQRCHSPQVDVNSEITFEEDDGTLPNGYLGTWKGIRFYAQDPRANVNCGGSLHHLTCGHWITAEAAPCGLNCAHEPDFNTAAFACLHCRSIVEEVIETKIMSSERAKIERAHATDNEVYVIGYLVEIVSKHVDIKDNLTETVIGIVRGDHGRKCAVAEPPVRSLSLEEQIREIKSWTASKKVVAENMRNAAAKRGTSDDNTSNPQKKARMNSSLHDRAAVFQSSRLARKFAEQTGKDGFKRTKMHQNAWEHEEAEFDLRVHLVGYESDKRISGLGRKRSLDMEFDTPTRRKKRVKSTNSSDGDEEPKFDPRVALVPHPILPFTSI